MIYPILAYGDPVLRQPGEDINANYPNLKQVIDDMWSTMYKAQGVGLAAPQVGLSIRLFIVDSVQLENEKKLPGFKGIKQVFINPVILDEEGEEWKYEEGCLSIPGIRENVWRKPTLRLRYLDENFREHIKDFDNINARVIQHEYDHIEGVLFTDRLKPLTKKMVQKKLQLILEGKVDADYKMRFVKR
jgi:peptide deformylase